MWAVCHSSNIRFIGIKSFGIEWKNGIGWQMKWMLKHLRVFQMNGRQYDDWCTLNRANCIWTGWRGWIDINFVKHCGTFKNDAEVWLWFTTGALSHLNNDVMNVSNWIAELCGQFARSSLHWIIMMMIQFRWIELNLYAYFFHCAPLANSDARKICET